MPKRNAKRSTAKKRTSHKATEQAATNHAARADNAATGRTANTQRGTTLVTHAVGAMPILQRLLRRMRLHDFLQQHLPPEDGRTKVATPRVILLLLNNLLVSRAPVYGVAEWAREFDPELFDLQPRHIEQLNDDRVGRCLDRLFRALNTNLIMDVVRHVVQEFDLSLDELHNDSTTVSFCGEYPDADVERLLAGMPTPAITWGHSKDHRPDLKQLLYILTVTNDGGVPIYFQTASGNVTDDQTHQATWQLLAELVGRKDFVYVADCKLATTEQMRDIASRGGRFITVLPATRKENATFRTRLVEQPESIKWCDLCHEVDEDGNLENVMQVCADEHATKEGFRLLWYHSLRKQASDAAARATRLERAMHDLTTLRDRLAGPRTRFRVREKVAAAVDAILDAYAVRELLRVEIEESEEAAYRQATRGRPSPKTKYVREVRTRFTIAWEVDGARLARESAGDGVFPLLTNLPEWTAREVLDAYKRQPIIEKRFSQLKTDFRVAPVYLKNVERIVGLLAVYFLALMVQSLLERELRRAMNAAKLPSIPLYPEGRPCTRPTTRRVLDYFAPLSRHTLTSPTASRSESITTALTPLHRQLLELLGIPGTAYDQ
jgi:transposase